MSRKWQALASVACGTFMATLDSSIVNIGLPTLTKQFDASLASVKWVVVVYLLTISCLLLPAGRISDQLGRRTTFVLGFGIFGLGSLLCGMAPTISGLIFFRVIQGIGAAMLMANGPAVITSVFPASERGGALGTMSMVVSAGLVSGPSLGGFLITSVGWRSIFLVNIPVAILGLYLASKNIEDSPHHREELRFDWSGAILQALILLLFLASVDPPQARWAQVLDAVPAWRWAMGAAAAGLFLIFIRVESQARWPVMDLGLLRIPEFWLPGLAGFLMFVGYSAVPVLMPFFLEDQMRLSPSQAGLMMTAIPLTIFVVAPISGRISDRIGNTGLSVAGGVVGALGLTLIAGFLGSMTADGSSSLGMILALCTVGLATGLFQSPNNSAIMNSVPPEKLGVASALLATFRNLGMVLGTGLSTALYSWRFSAHGDQASAIQVTFLVAAAVTLTAAVVSFIRRARR